MTISIVESQTLMNCSFHPQLTDTKVCGQFLDFMNLRVYGCAVKLMLNIFALKDFGPSQGKFMIFYDNGIRFPIFKNSYTFMGLNI